MTLSNFHKTDKESVRWFIMLPTGHEGPYSLFQLEQLVSEGTISSEIKVWAQGMAQAVPLHTILTFEGADEDVPPPLPPLPEDESDTDDLPPLPIPEESETENSEEETPPKKRKYVLISSLVLLLILGAGIFLWVKSLETFTIRRFPKMSRDLHARILKENAFEGWDKTLFFKEYVPSDLSHLWLVSSSFHNCQVEATFTSVPGKLLTLEEEAVAFSGQAHLSEHVAEISTFNFTQGNKIIPGLYDMHLKASECQWDGVVPKLANVFSEPERSYEAKTKVVLYPGGAAKFNEVLSKLLKKKEALENKSLQEESLFWQDIQQKLQTLLAISLQIEQLFLDLLEKNPATFKKDVQTTIDQYTQKFGHFLTNFVVANEEYFNELAKSNLKDLSRKRNFEPLIRMTSKRIGHESMKFIERMQGLKTNVRPQDIQTLRQDVKKTYEALKLELNRKIIQISEERTS